MSIPVIHVDDLGSVQIQNVTVPNYHLHQPNVNHLTPPVVVNIGNPIIDMPGCVKAVSYTHLTLPTIYSV